MNKRRIISALLCIASLIACKPLGGAPKEEEKEDVPEIAENTWLINGSEDINTYQTADPSNRKTLILAKNETEHVQLVIATDSEEPLTISRKGEETIRFQCRTVKVFDKMEDILVPCHEEVTPEGNIAKIWLSFTTDITTKPGTYGQVISFKSSTKEYLVKVYVKVEDVTIPITPSIPAVMGIRADRICERDVTGSALLEKQKEFSDLLLSYRVSPYFCTWLSGTMMLECNSSPYPVGTEDYWNYLHDKRFAAIAFPSAKLDDETLKNMLTRASSEGLLEKGFFYIWDEPTLMKEYDSIRNKADRIHSYAPSARILTTYYCGPKDGDRQGDLLALWDILEGATSIYCTGVWSLGASESKSEQCYAKCKDGQEWWCYVCMGDYPGLAFNSGAIANRAVMWREWKERSKGFLYWAVNAFSSLSPLTPRQDLPQGDAILVLPGKSFGVEEPCISMRFERWRDGMEDYELLLQYENKLGRKAAEDMLKNVYSNPSNFTDQSKYVEAFHKHLIQDIL